MRQIFFYTLILLAAPAWLSAQDPVAAAMRNTVWPDAGAAGDGFGWSIFSRQYYSIANWNATGILAGYTSGSGRSDVLICRDGIPGYSWYHFYLSHSRQFKKISGMLQLRFSMIRLKEQPPVLRLGGNINMCWTMSQMLNLQVSIYDFPGWLLPSNATRGDPAMEFLLFHEPGRLIGLMAGFQISQLQFGPVTSGIRINLNDKVDLLGQLKVLPFGVTLGMSWKLSEYKAKIWLEQRNGLGVTPTMLVGSK